MVSPFAVSLVGDDIRRMAEVLREFPGLVLEEVASGIFQAELLLLRETIERTPTSGVGTLRQSMIAEQPRIEGETVLGMMGSPLPYAMPVEAGTKPHMPPEQPIMDWVEQKLGLSGEKAEKAVQAIRWKIKHHGTKGAYMFSGALEHNLGQVGDIITASARRAVARFEAEAG